MKAISRLTSIAALAYVGASMAHAQAYASGLGYASAVYYQSSPGLYFTAMAGQYYSYSISWVGNNWATGLYYGGGFPNPQWSEAYGYSAAWPQVGGAGVSSGIDTWNDVTVSNLSNHWDMLTIGVYTDSSSYAAMANWNGYAYDWAAGEYYDTAGLILQESFTGAYSMGLGLGGNSGYAFNYDIYNGLTGGSAFFGNAFPFAVSSSAADFQYYNLWFAPGASDTFVTYAIDPHTAYAVAPGPAALAPFALGVVGLMRRRRKA